MVRYRQESNHTALTHCASHARHKVASAAPGDASTPTLGDLLRVKGRISSYNGQVQLNCTSFGAHLQLRPRRCSAASHSGRAEVCVDPHVELLHWLDATGQSRGPGAATSPSSEHALHGVHDDHGL